MVSVRGHEIVPVRASRPFAPATRSPSRLLYRTSPVDYLIVAFSPGHNGPRFLVIGAHRCYSLEPISMHEDVLEIERAHK